MALIRFSQPPIIGQDGQSVLGLDGESAVTMTDVGGGPAEYAWEFLSWPSPLEAPPPITNASSQTATAVGPFLDGIYIVRLTKNDASGTTQDIKFFGIADADGLSLPSAGMTREMANVSGNASRASGWAGSAAGSSNVLLDAFLRKRRLREGRYAGSVQYRSFSGTAAETVNLTYGVDASIQYAAVEAGPQGLTFNFLPAGLEAGSAFRFFLRLEVGCSPVVLTFDGDVLGSFAASTLQPHTNVEVFAVYLGAEAGALADPALHGWVLQVPFTPTAGSITSDVLADLSPSPAGTYGGASTVPVVTINDKGLVVGAFSEYISAGISSVNVTAPIVKSGSFSDPIIGVTVGTTSNSVCAGNDARLSNTRTPTPLSPSPAGTYGSATAIPVMTVNSAGQVTGVTTASVQSGLYDLQACLLGKPTDGTTVYAYVAQRATTLSTSASQYSFRCLTAGTTAASTFTVSKVSGGVTSTIVTVTFAIGSTSGTVTTPANTSLAAGDFVVITATSVDAALTDIFFTIRASV